MRIRAAALSLSSLIFITSSAPWASDRESELLLEHIHKQQIPPPPAFDPLTQTRSATPPVLPSIPTLLAQASTEQPGAKKEPQEPSHVHNNAIQALPQETSPHTYSANLALISQYIYRGLTQSNSHPALQGGFDYSHQSGLYAGIWASSITWIRDSRAYVPNPSANVEIDLYGGLKRSLEKYPDWAYDLGFLRYEYPGSYPSNPTKPNTNELYGALSWKWLTAKYSYSLGSTFGVADAKGTSYLDLTAAIPVRDDLTLTLHAGRQAYKGTADATLGSNDSLYTYNDFRVEVAKNYSSNWQFGIGATATSAKDAGYFYSSIEKNIGRTTAYVFVKKTF